jgi:hypothetical protein
MSEATNDDPTTDEPSIPAEANIDPDEAKARLDELEENIQQTRREAEEHGTLGAAADDDEQRFVDDGDVDDEMNTQGIAPPA